METCVLFFRIVHMEYVRTKAALGNSFGSIRVGGGS